MKDVSTHPKLEAAIRYALIDFFPTHLHNLDAFFPIVLKLCWNTKDALQNITMSINALNIYFPVSYCAFIP